MLNRQRRESLRSRFIDETFIPNHIAIETGQTVTWINGDDDDHTASGRGMDSGIMTPGSSGSVHVSGTWRI